MKTTIVTRAGERLSTFRLRLHMHEVVLELEHGRIRRVAVSDVADVIHMIETQGPE